MISASPLDRNVMDTYFRILLMPAVAMAGVTLQAYRIGNERRDVVALGAISGLLGVGSVLAAVA